MTGETLTLDYVRLYHTMATEGLEKLLRWIERFDAAGRVEETEEPTIFAWVKPRITLPDGYPAEDAAAVVTGFGAHPSCIKCGVKR